ncbi:hypothetical protein ACIPIN_07250 [Pseudomonas sp. NPDC087697]|uniref:hypothetical protein n=1 Tax=Pseudomonas sp. NPDC087697 TaxID=3364447 RepID=UPI0038185CBB
MHLIEILNHHPQRPAQGVPDWMLGYYKRKTISFADGQTDLRTHVCWFQSRNFTLDVRLPLEAQQVGAKPLSDCSPAEFYTLANYEGWEARSVWEGETLAWQDATSFQLHNRWPEPAVLQRIGNCMIEFAPSAAYVEDWRLQSSGPGALIGLRLIEDKEPGSGVVHHRGGGVIVCGDHAAMVLGRAAPLATDPECRQLREQLLDHLDDPTWLAQAFNFEASVAQGSLTGSYDVMLSTLARRLHQPLMPMDGFELLPDAGYLQQFLVIDGIERHRLFAIDTLEVDIGFAQSTAFTAEAARWYEQESPTLSRYTQALF